MKGLAISKCANVILELKLPSFFPEHSVVQIRMYTRIMAMVKYQMNSLMTRTCRY